MMSAELFLGTHTAESGRKCLLENIAFLAGEEHSDHPQCVSFLLAAFGRKLNDLLPHVKRQELRQYELQMMGTSDDGKDPARAKLCSEFAQKMAEYWPTAQFGNVSEASTFPEFGVTYAVRNLSRAIDYANDVGSFEVKVEDIYDEAIAFLGILIKGGE